MAHASQEALQRAELPVDKVDLVVPHQANLRIIEAVAKKCGTPMDRVYVSVQRYGNMSAATVPVALVDALAEGRVKPGSLILMPGFGGGLTLCAHLVRWGERVKPIAESDAQLPDCTHSALELVNAIRASKRASGASAAALRDMHFVEEGAVVPA